MISIYVESTTFPYKERRVTNSDNFSNALDVAKILVNNNKSVRQVRIVQQNEDED